MPHAKHRGTEHHDGASGAGVAVANEYEERVIRTVFVAQPVRARTERPIQCIAFARQFHCAVIEMGENGLTDNAVKLDDLRILRRDFLVRDDEISAFLLQQARDVLRDIVLCEVGPVRARLERPLQRS